MIETSETVLVNVIETETEIETGIETETEIETATEIETEIEEIETETEIETEIAIEIVIETETATEKEATLVNVRETRSVLLHPKKRKENAKERACGINPQQVITPVSPSYTRTL